MLIKCADVKIGKRYRSKVGDLNSLCESIKEFGLLQPIGLNKQKELIFGQRRLQAHIKLGIAKIEARVFNLDDLGVLKVESEENAERVDISADDKLALAAAIKAKLKERRGNPNLAQTGENTQEPSSSSNSATSGGIGNAPVVDPVQGQESRDAIAKAAGFSSHHEYERSKAVQEKAPAEIWQAVQDGVIKLGDAFKCLGENNILLLKALDRVKAGTAKTLKAGLKEPSATTNAKAAVSLAIHHVPPSEDSEPDLDPCGRAIPHHLSQVRADSKALADYAIALASLKKLLSEMKLDKYRAANLALPTVNLCENLKHAIQASTFYCVCVYCEGKNEECKVCKGAGWCNKDVYTSAPHEKKKVS